ncbi:MAG: hypothetical protein QM760_04040 [Nibricoccus sp.]
MNSRFLPLVFAAALCAASSLTVSAADLTIAQVKTSPENWPTQIKVNELLDFGAVKIPAGTVVEFQGFENANARFQYKGKYFLIEPEVTDLLVRANRIASGQAAKEGWRGRFADYLVRRGQMVNASGFAAVPPDTFKENSILVVYYGSTSCSYCSSALPFMKLNIEQLERRYPGRILRVYSTGDSDNPAAKNYARNLGPGWIIAPLGDQYMWAGLTERIPAAANALNYPALALVTPKGNFLAAGMREQSNLDSAANVLRKLEDILSTPGKMAALENR